MDKKKIQKEYLKPEAEVINFDYLDIIRTSTYCIVDRCSEFE